MRHEDVNVRNVTLHLVRTIIVGCILHSRRLCFLFVEFICPIKWILNYTLYSNSRFKLLALKPWKFILYSIFSCTHQFFLLKILEELTDTIFYGFLIFLAFDRIRNFNSLFFQFCQFHLAG